MKTLLLFALTVFSGFVSFSQEELRRIEFEISSNNKEKAEKLNLITDFTISYDSTDVVKIIPADSLGSAQFENIYFDTLNNTLTFSQISADSENTTIHYTISDLSKSKLKANVVCEDDELTLKGYQYKYCTNHTESHACRLDRLKQCSAAGCMF